VDVTGLADDVGVDVKAEAVSGAGVIGDHTAAGLIVDNTLPVVPSGAITSPAEDDVWQVEVGGNITWAGVTDDNFGGTPISLFYSWDAGATWAPIAGAEANDGTYTWDAAQIPSTQAQIKLVATDLAGNTRSALSGIFTLYAAGVDPDFVDVELTAPTDDDVVSGDVELEAEAEAISGIQKVEFEYSDDAATWTLIGTATEPDGVAVASVNLAYSLTWDTTGVDDGWYFVRATATSGLGNTETDDDAVEVLVDNSAPSVAALLAPDTNYTVADYGATDVYTATAAAYDPHTVIDTVTFQYSDDGGATWDDLGEGALDGTTGWWELVLNTSDDLDDGAVLMRVIATNSAGLETESAAKVVTIDNATGVATVAEQVEVDLLAGQNLISLPVVPVNGDIWVMMSGLLENLEDDTANTVTQVATFDPVPTQKTWAPGTPVQSLTSMRDGQGYWVKSVGAATLWVIGLDNPLPPTSPPQYTVLSGWNLIGYKSQGDDGGIEDYLGTPVFDDAQALYGFDAATQLFGTPTFFQPGEGYWLAGLLGGTIYP
jgi:hypothetical protein